MKAAPIDILRDGEADGPHEPDEIERMLAGTFGALARKANSRWPIADGQ